MPTNNNQIEFTYTAEYASEVMSTIPAGYINKTVCGCGLTTIALENDVPTIIAVPTIELATNKCVQYPNSRTNNIILPVWGETTRDIIDNYIYNSNVIKIMVTNDSLYKVAHLLPHCHLVIDESNLLVSYAKMKPEVIAKVFELAHQYKDTVSFISATPTPLEYLPDWVRDIPQIKINWTNTIKFRPFLCERRFPYKSLKNEFVEPLYRNKELTIEGKTFSKIIVFVNSIEQIVDVVNDTGIEKSDCSVICGNSLRNDLKVHGIKRYKTGVMPMFTFITSAGFNGIDLHDDSAMTIVVSHTGKSWHMIDVLTDLKQAVSRQRNKKNPNYGSYIYIYNQSIFKHTEEELLSILIQIREKIQVNIPHFEHLRSSGKERCIITDADFKAYTLLKEGKYTLNEQVFSCDMYFILEIRKQYEKGFDVAGILGNCEIIKPVSLPKEITYKTLLQHFRRSKGKVEWGVYSSNYEWINVIEESYRLFGKVWGNYTYAKRMVENYGKVHELVKIEVQSIFPIGTRLSRKYVKTELQKIYDRYQVERNAYHSDLHVFFSFDDIKANSGERYVLLRKKVS